MNSPWHLLGEFTLCCMTDSANHFEIVSSMEKELTKRVLLSVNLSTEIKGILGHMQNVNICMHTLHTSLYMHIHAYACYCVQQKLWEISNLLKICNPFLLGVCFRLLYIALKVTGRVTLICTFKSGYMIFILGKKITFKKDWAGEK